MSIGLSVFLTIAIIAIASAIAMLLSRNTIYSALFLIINFVAISLLYFFLGAPLIALAQITVYAGSIMVLFLFVIMLIGTEKLSRTNSMPWHKPVALVLSALLLIEAAVLIYQQTTGIADWPEMLPGSTSPVEIGLALFNQYLLPFEITSVILLVAVIGAIYLTRPERIRRKSGNNDERSK